MGLRRAARGRADARPGGRALNYVVTPSAIIDFIAIVPFFIVLSFGGADLRTMVLLRLMRLFKLGRYSTGFQSLFEAIRRERHALLASFLVLISIVLVAASLAYIAERQAQPEDLRQHPARHLVGDRDRHHGRLWRRRAEDAGRPHHRRRSP